MIASEFAFSGFAAGGNNSASPQAPGQSPPSFCTFISATDKSTAIARKRSEVTDFGKFLDPIADKLLVFSALLILPCSLVNVWFVFIILLREFLVSALRMVASANGEVIAADNLGRPRPRSAWYRCARTCSVSRLSSSRFGMVQVPPSCSRLHRRRWSPQSCLRSSRAHSTSGTPVTSFSACSVFHHPRKLAGFLRVCESAFTWGFSE
ncbi:MAG: CDP-alcohol phosphatidyltransferase family protein [Collinsella intestinalis]